MRFLTTCIGFMLWASLAWAQPAFVNVQTAISSDPYTTVTIPNLAVSGTNPGILVCITEESAAFINSVVFNGSEALSQVTSSSMVSVWYRGGVTATTANVVITMSVGNTTGALLATGLAFSGVSAGLPTLFNSAIDTTTTSVSVDLTTTVANTMVATCLWHTAHTNSWTSHGAGQTERSDFANSDAPGSGSGTTTELRVGAGLDTFTSTWSGGTGGQRRAIAVGIEPFVEPPPTSTERRRTAPIMYR